MTTVSSTSGNPASTASTNAPKPAPKPYDGKAAVAQAQTKATAALAAQDKSILNIKLAELPTTVIDLLQGGTGNDLVNTLFGSDDDNPVNNLLTASLTKKALAAAAYKRGQNTAATSSLDALINKLIATNSTPVKTNTKA